MDKPRQWSSFQVVNKIKWHIRKEFGLKNVKIGHAGTLDPLASGLLLICVGKATKEIERLQQGEKEYSGTMVLGATTPCYDLERAVDHLYPYKHINQELVEKTIADNYLGEIEQIPPHFSAVKVAGERAYQTAREGEKVEIAAKKVLVKEFRVEEFRQGDPNKTPALPRIQDEEDRSGKELYRNPRGSVPEGLPEFDFYVRCGKGTYIRSLARDLGESLGSGGFLSGLRRERIGDYTIDMAIAPEATCERLQNSEKEQSEI